MKTLVITGSTRGIGFGLAREFLKRGCSVVINGRTPAVVEKAVSELAATHGRERVFGHAADVSIYEQTEGLWEAARAQFGRVDVWVNNAGIAHPIDIPLWDQPPEQMRAVVGLNLLGTLYGVRIAGRGMKAQGGGTIYLMEGFGSDGRTRGGLGLYGATKAALRYAAKALKADTAEWATPVKFGTISPGIVITDMIIGQYTGREQEFERAKKSSTSSATASRRSRPSSPIKCWPAICASPGLRPARCSGVFSPQTSTNATCSRKAPKPPNPARPPTLDTWHLTPDA